VTANLRLALQVVTLIVVVPNCRPPMPSRLNATVAATPQPGAV
jgi:hypothetical protein